MTPMSNAEYLTRLQNSEELARLKEAKRVSGLSYEQLAEKIGVSKVWLPLRDSSMCRRSIVKSWRMP